MSLVNEIIKGLLPEDEKRKVVAVYGGGFKPPTAGHFEVAQQALKENPEIDEFIIYIGGKERNGISPDESILIWDIYKQYLPYKVEVKYTSVPPIKSIYNYAKEHPDEDVLFVIGAREGNEDDFSDIAKRTTSLDKYPNLNLRTIVTQGGVSGTAARNASKISLDKFKPFVPSELSDEEVEEVYNIVADKIQENEPEDGKAAPYGSGYKKLNENASYKEYIGIQDKIDQLTDHMISKGMNIEPLPSLEFVDGDSENAKDFFGKTAYYDPNRQHIVLYTEGRHPKDIVRSYAHEMIHHIQHLEDRLGDISGTDTTSDEHLTKLEKEANLRGTMTFRNWTDSLLNEAIVGDKIVCDNCDWSWKIVDGGDDLFICHKCGHDNTPLNEANKPYKHKSGFNDKLGKDPFGLNQYARELATGLEEATMNEGRYDTLTTKLSSIAFEAFKDIHDRGDKEGSFEFRVDNPDDEHDIPSKDFFFDFVGKVEITDDEYGVDGGANAGFDNKGEEITPLLSVKFKIPKNPNWQKVSFDIKDVVRHELEHLTQEGYNQRSSKYMEDDTLVRDLIDAEMLPKSQYFKLEKEVDAMLQGLYFKAKKSKRPFKDVIDDYLDIFVNQETITQEEKNVILDIWRSRGKSLSLPLFEQDKDMDYEIYSDMDGVLTDFDASFMKASDGILPSEYEKNFGKDGFWKLIDERGVGYWAGMPWMSDGKIYWDYIKKYKPTLLSSPSRSSTSRLGKRLWVKNNIPGTKLILAQSKDKQNYAQKDRILIDDRPSNIDQWRASGGIGILHISASDTIRQLKELGL